MAVQGSDKKTRLCERCFANVPADAATCPECGAQMKTDASMDGTDAAIYPELSRANLLRMRGDYKGAEAQCLAILKRYPNNATVHTLMGDIYAEQDDLEQAAQWYELALDLNPSSLTDEQKLASVRERMRQREGASSVEQLGLPLPKSGAPLFAALALGVVFLVGMIAFYVGQNARTRPRTTDVVSVPLDAPPGSETDATTTTGTAASTIGTTFRPPQEERELMALIQQRSTFGGTLLNVQIDPRSRIISLTYSPNGSDDEKRVGAELARTAFEQNQDALIVTVRSIRGDRTSYMADASRSRFQEITGGAWQNAPTESWVNHLLTNEWPAATSTPPVTTPSATPPDTSAPATTNGVTGAGFTPPLNNG